MKIKMTAIFGEQFCEDLKEALDCSTDEEFLGAFKGMMAQALSSENISKDDLSIKCELA